MRFFWQNHEEPGMLTSHILTPDPQMDMIRDALAHYCEHCKTGFKTKGATLAHKRYKHKPTTDEV